MQQFALRQGVAYLEDAIVWQTYYVACPCLVDGALALCHKLCGRGEAQRLVLTYVQIGLVALKLTRTNLAESDTRTVVGVDVCSDFEDKACKLRFLGRYHALLCLSRTWGWGYFNKAVEQLLHAKVVKRTTKEYWCHLCCTISLHIKLGIDSAYQFEVFTKFHGIIFSHSLVQFLRVYIHAHFLRNPLLVGGEEVELVLVNVKDALEACTLVDRPGKRTHFYLEFLFQFVEQFKGVTTFAVHLVDEDDNGGVPHAAYLHQFASLSLHTFCTVHYYDGRIYCRKGAIGILAEVLVTRRVKNVHLVVAIVKLHDGC